MVLSPGSAYGPNGEGFFRISLTRRRAPRRGARTAALQSGRLTTHCGVVPRTGCSSSRCSRRSASRSRRSGWPRSSSSSRVGGPGRGGADDPGGGRGGHRGAHYAGGRSPPLRRAAPGAGSPASLGPTPRDRELAQALAALGSFQPPAGEQEGVVPDGTFREARVFETNPDAVFCAPPGTPAARQAPPPWPKAAGGRARGGPGARRRRRALEPAHRGDRRGGRRPVRAPLRGGPRRLAGRPRGGLSSCSPGLDPAGVQHRRGAERGRVYSYPASRVCFSPVSRSRGPKPSSRRAFSSVAQ